MTLTASAVRSALRDLASPERAASSMRFFKTGKGEYGEGDVFIGVDVPTQRKIAKAFSELPLTEALKLLASKFHEDRMTALFILVLQYQRAKTDLARRTEIFDAYLASRDRVNNWDLVDSSASQIVGAHLEGSIDRSLLDELLASDHLWSRRIGIIATHHFIRQGDFVDALRLSAKLLGDGEDLMHKATGWMLREIGERDRAALDGFLRAHAASMPRTMLRYAIEKHDAPSRARWLDAKRTSTRKLAR